jgi:hypothetical protein
MEALAGGRIQDRLQGDGPYAGRRPDALQRVAALTCRVADVDEAVILLRADPQPAPLAAVARHRRPDAGAFVAWPAGKGAAERALSSGEPSADARRGRRSTAAAPLMVDGGARGVLVVSARSVARRFGRAQLDLLTDLAAVASSIMEERELLERAEAVLDAGAEVLARAVDIRDDYTGHHSTQVGAMAMRVGARLGMDTDELQLLGYAARLHDVGKLAVPDAILLKPGPLDEDEWEVMRRHPDWGAEIVASVPGLERLAELVRAHHERWDGSGYPGGLSGDHIPLASRVIAVCDAFEAMVSRRPYRAPLTLDEALAELTAGAGSQFDPEVVAAVDRENNVAPSRA